VKYYTGRAILENITVKDLGGAVYSAGGLPTTIVWGIVAGAGLWEAIHDANIDRISMGMFALRHRETLRANGIELDLKKTKNGAENATQEERVKLAKKELKDMDEFVRLVKDMGFTPEYLTENGLYPEYFTGFYYEVRGINRTENGYYDHGIYHDEHRLYSAEH